MQYVQMSFKWSCNYALRSDKKVLNVPRLVKIDNNSGVEISAGGNSCDLYKLTDTSQTKEPGKKE